jgi:hypothetical protein
MSTTVDHIDKYISHFKKRIDAIENIKSSDFEDDFKKTLYVAIIDSLSKSVYPHSNNRDRFTSFIENFGDWENGSKISLPHFVKLLSLTPEPIFEDARKFARNELIKWSGGEIIYLDSDPEIVDLRRYWPGQTTTKLLNEVRLISLQHYHLFYSYRNSLVHESRHLGISMDEIDNEKPFYVHISKFDDIPTNIIHVWQLTYPEIFFHNLCTNSLRNLSAYLMANDIDPIDFYSEGNYFIEELNL